VGHAAAAEIAKESVETGRSVAEIALGRNLLDERRMRKILDPVRMTTPMRLIRQAFRNAKRKTRNS
jgi:aspartate ammonia-lyase